MAGTIDMIKITRFIFWTYLSVMLASCASHTQHNSYSPLNESANYYPYIQPSFDDYLSETKTWLEHNRSFITQDRNKELSMNMPFELAPKGSSNKAILLVHGLGDSPYSFSDLAVTYQAKGFHVQTLLLPGHGSKPADLMLPSYQDWQTIVDHYANLLKEEYQEVWLGGFSTGGNLVTIHAMEQGGISGLVLVSPGFQSKAPFLEKFASIASWFTDGYQAEETNLARYSSAPLNGAIAYSDSASKVREKLAHTNIEIPTILVLSEADSVVDPFAVKRLFDERFKHERNTLIWYGETQMNTHSLVAKTMRISRHKISTASHMSPLFAPSNEYYGEQGQKRMCMNSFSDQDIARCEAGEVVWFAAWGYEEEGKVHARLTWNPYYSELEETVQRVSE